MGVPLNLIPGGLDGDNRRAHDLFLGEGGPVHLNQGLPGAPTQFAEQPPVLAKHALQGLGEGKDHLPVTLPTSVREKVGLAVGDVLEAEVKGKKITLTPKAVVDRDFIEKRLAEGLKDIEEGRVSPAFTSTASAIRYLRRQAKKLKKSQ